MTAGTAANQSPSPASGGAGTAPPDSGFTSSGRAPDTGASAGTDQTKNQTNNKTNHRQRPPRGGLHAIQEAGRHFAKVRHGMSWYAAVHADRARVAIGDLIHRTLLGLLAGLLVTVVLCLAAARLLTGVAGAITAALDGSVWQGNLLTGALTLLTVSAGLYTATWIYRSRRWRALQRRHEGFRERNRELTATTAAKGDRDAPRN